MDSCLTLPWAQPGILLQKASLGGPEDDTAFLKGPGVRQALLDLTEEEITL